MGTMFYGATEQAIEVEDGLLTHVQAVILTKLRRGECFSLTSLSKKGDEKQTVWVSSAIPLRIVLGEGRAEKLDQGLLVRLIEAANSHRGLDLSSATLAAPVPIATPRRARVARAA